jgi:hypothetical protein
MAKIPLGARVEPETKAAMQKAARQERRPLSQLVEVILLEWLEARKEGRRKPK